MIYVVRTSTGDTDYVYTVRAIDRTQALERLESHLGEREKVIEINIVKDDPITFVFSFVRGDE